jgi:hypothetical protein
VLADAPKCRWISNNFIEKALTERKDSETSAIFRRLIFLIAGTSFG